MSRTWFGELVIASSTYGQTYHDSFNPGGSWDKGFRNGGATTYTGFYEANLIAITAPTINSSGWRCA